MRPIRYFLARLLLPRQDREEIVVALEYLIDATSKTQVDLRMHGEAEELLSEYEDELLWLERIADGMVTK